MRSAAGFRRPAAFADAALTDDEAAIARSVIYASLFDYPLTLAQLRQTLIESTQTPSQVVAAYHRSEALQAVIELRDGFFFPRGRADLIDERRRREARSRVFLRRHQALLALICALPYVRLVALSGSVAHLNLEGTGDLDLFIVTRGKRVWSTTVAVLIVAKLLRRRRILCANFVIADSRLALDQPDLFTASQIIHLKPLVGREVYRRLLAANPFVSRFYPNFHDVDPVPVSFRSSWAARSVKRVAEIVLAPLAPVAEAACRVAYRGYLARRAASWRSPDQVRLHADYLKLHTQSHRQSVLDRYDRGVRAVSDTTLTPLRHRPK